MTTEPTLPQPDPQKPEMVRRGGGLDAVYGIGLIGAWAYYIGRATTPQHRFLGFFKGFFWPAFLVYELFESLEKR